jgi:hypothetical protein
MTAPRLESCYFTAGGGDHWSRMAHVLAHTAARHCPDWAVSIRACQPPPMRSQINKASHVSNAQKTAYWCDRVLQAPDGARVLLMDVDTVIVRPLDEVWTMPFDVAYTIRSGFAFPLNAGVVFLRVSDGTRAFMTQWRDVTVRKLEETGAATLTWRRAYGGIAQGALGELLAQPHGLDIRPLPCAEWNCEDSAWRSYDPAVTRIVHLKSALQKAIFGRIATPPELRPLVQLWKGLETEASRAAAAVSA